MATWVVGWGRGWCGWVGNRLAHPTMHGLRTTHSGIQHGCSHRGDLLRPRQEGVRIRSHNQLRGERREGSCGWGMTGG